jgi:hypothetical protein
MLFRARNAYQFEVPREYSRPIRYEVILGERDIRIEDKDVPAGVLMVLIAERRATLLGLNPSPGFAVQVVQHPPVEQKTSTQEIRAVLDELIGHSSAIDAEDEADHVRDKH